MSIHAGPYIDRTIRDKLRWAHQFRVDADVAEAKAIELRAAASKIEAEAAKMAFGTDFEPISGN